MIRGAGSRVLGLGLLLTSVTACRSDRAMVPTPTPSSQIAATPTPVVAPTPVSAALPRTVDAVALSMPRSSVEAQVGALDCDDTPDGVHVCKPRDAARSSKQLQIYFFRNAVVSIAWEIPPPAEVWSHLEGMIQQYGKPSLNGMTERDAAGRTHEVYGWRDDRSLYSVRFVWEESPPPRHVINTVLTIWDRTAYGQWEDEKTRRTGNTDAAIGPGPT